MEFAKRITSVSSMPVLAANTMKNLIISKIKPALCASGPFTVWTKTTMMNDKNDDNTILPSTLRLRVNFPQVVRTCRGAARVDPVFCLATKHQAKKEVSDKRNFLFLKVVTYSNISTQGIPFQVREGGEVPDPQNIKVLILAGVGRKEGVTPGGGRVGLHGGRG